LPNQSFESIEQIVATTIQRRLEQVIVECNGDGWQESKRERERGELD